METRLTRKFDTLRRENAKAFVAFVTAGDPDLATAQKILDGLPKAGADIIELGMPFTDPMADGAAIQAASHRALAAGGNMQKTFALVRNFRAKDDTTPLILMGYYNPIHQYGAARFLTDARAAGVDGLIVVDLPPEEDAELCLPALAAGLHFIRMATPTSDEARLPAILANVSGFVYYVSVTGITGAKTAAIASVADAVARIKRHTDLPIIIGFGIKTPQDARKMAAIGDGAVVGTVLVDTVKAQLKADGRAKQSCAPAVLKCASGLAAGVKKA